MNLSSSNIKNCQKTAAGLSSVPAAVTFSKDLVKHWEAARPVLVISPQPHADQHSRKGLI